MVVYFTGTGNSRWCARKLAERLDDELLDCSGYIRHNIAADLISGKPWVFVSPTYAWQLPHVFADFIRSGNFAGQEDAYFVMTCGSDIGNAVQSIETLCREVGLNCKGVLPVVMPENYIAMFEVPEAAKAAEIRAAAEPVLQEAAAEISQGMPFAGRKITAADRLKSGIVNKAFYRMFMKTKDFYATDACIGCGVCAERCVLQNISIRDGKPIWGDACTHCMSCICGCPAEAIEYGSKSKRKPRYWCE